ncbi:MAG TPA: TonB-dependent receptor [Ignavibacteriaceae bacterium]|nr:TonB-dependent receptor [Ignavibacteriaceae bacterium]
MRKILLLISFLIYSSGSIIWGGTTGKLSGKVIDAATKEAMPFVNIILMGTNFGAASDLDGNYVILNLPPGKYTVRAQAIGYQPVEVENVSISIDLTTTVDFEMKETAVELEAVIVQSKQDIVKKDITSSQSLISSDQIQALPVSEFDDVLQLQAGVTKDADGGFHIRGGRTTEIAYWVNGVSITDAYDNSRGIQIDNNSIQELQVISGTFNAEYGNAMSGIINTVTKEGGKDYHGSLLLYGGDHVSNFTDYFPHINNIDAFSNYNIQGSLSGTVPYTDNVISFFVNGRYFYDDGYLYGERRYNPDGTPGDGAVVPMNWHRTAYGQGNIALSPFQNFKINLEGLYSKDDYQDYNHEYVWNPDGDVNKFSESYDGTLTLTHTFSSSAFYTVKGSFFNKDFNEYLYKDPHDPRYLHPDSLIRPDNYSFRTKGTNLHRFNRETRTYLGKIDFTSQVTDQHLLKFGAEVKSHRLQFDDFTLEPLRINNIPVEPFQPEIPGETQTNRDKYENKPLEASAYVQDKIEFEKVIINVGVRLDYFDANGKVLVDITDPNIYAPLHSPSFFGLSLPNDQWTDEAVLANNSLLTPYFYKNSDPKFQVSPRFGIAYPISADGVVHFSYGHFLQIPPFQFLYQKGPYKVPNSGVFVGVYGNPDLKPQKTVMYEIGFRQEFGGDYLVDVTGFYRDVRNWITAGPIIETRNLSTYSIFTNKDYANVKGITLTFSKRFTNYFSFDLNYTYQVAEGTNSKPEDEFEAAKGSAEPSLYLIPMDWDQNHLLNASVYTSVEGFGISLLARYGTGLPYSPTITQYTAERGITSGLIKNSRRIPSQFSMDLKLDKTFMLMGFDINAFVRVFNLLDNKIPLKVFGDTGEPDFTTEIQQVGANASRPNTVGEYLKYPDHYGEPRNVQFGFELSF